MPLLPTPRRLKGGLYWYAQTKLQNGQWKQFNTGQTDKRRAREVLRRVELEIAAGRDPFRHGTGTGQTIHGLAEEYLAEVAARGRRSKTLRSYRETLGKCRAVWGDVPITDIGKNAVAALETSMAGLSETSRNIHRANLRAFLRWCADREEFGNWKPPRIIVKRLDPDPAIDYYTAEECAALLSVDSVLMGGLEFRLFVAVLIYTGMRKCEAGELRWERGGYPWVDLATNQIVTPAGMVKGRRERHIPILPDLRTIFEDWPAERKGRLFPFDVSGGKVIVKWNRLCAAAEVKRLKLHNLRDTFIVHMLLSRVPWAAVMDIVGHTDPATMKRYYAVIGSAELQSAVSGIRPFVTSLITGTSK